MIEKLIRAVMPWFLWRFKPFKLACIQHTVSKSVCSETQSGKNPHKMLQMAPYALIWQVKEPKKLKKSYTSILAEAPNCLRHLCCCSVDQICFSFKPWIFWIIQGHWGQTWLDDKKQTTKCHSFECSVLTRMTVVTDANVDLKQK